MKDIENFEGLYAITSCGRVWSYRSKKFLKPFKPKNGYLCMSLYKDNIRKTFLVHRLVAEAYIPNPNNLPEVDHIDSNKEHNYLRNLQWINHKSNVQKAKGKKVICKETEQLFNSIEEAANLINRHRQGISDCCRGIQKTCGGFHWKYVEG